MQRNIELKTRFANFQRAADGLGELGAVEQPVMRQTDTYFFSVTGRLKLRQFGGCRDAELIWYSREDVGNTRPSDYLLIKIADPDSLKIALSAANGFRGVVRKVRRWFLWQNVRIHLDEVENLGRFLEFEAVLSDTETEHAAHGKIALLCEKLGIDPADHLDNSYADLFGL